LFGGIGKYKQINKLGSRIKNQKSNTMTKNFSIFVLTLLLLSVTNVNAQEKWSIRDGLGTASGITAVDGIYYSFDIGIPLTKSLEISPVFNFFSTLPIKRLDNSWNEYSPTYSLIEGDKNHYSVILWGQ